MKIVLSALMLFAAATQAEAKTLTLTKSLKLKADRGSYFFSVFFLESAPGKPSKEVISPGCWISTSSDTPAISKGDYAITLERFAGNDVWDSRYYYTAEARVGKTSITVSCKSYEPVNYDTVNRGLAGLVRINN